MVLQETALRLRAVLRDSDTVVRLGGDESAAILPTVRDMATAATAAAVEFERWFHEPPRGRDTKFPVALE